MPITVFLFLLYSQVMTDVQDPSYYLAMPTARTRPEWFMPLLAEMPDIILKHLRKIRPSPRPLPSFMMSGNDLDSDGIHLNALAGITYVQFLVDKPRFVLL